MTAMSRFGPVSRRVLVLATLPLLFLTACATGRPVQKTDATNEETVDIGYGRVGKDHTIGAISTVKGQDLDGAPFRTVADMLAQVPGVLVSAGSGIISVRIRGTGSFLGGQEPLLVVDGMIVQSTGATLAAISPSVIDNITVLKDAGSTAIYGSRGANGVILIKTKQRLS